MNCRRRVCATVVTVAAFFFCCVWVVTGRAWAGDNEDARVMLFSGRDIWRNGVFVYGGLVFAPGGLEQDGLLLKVLLSGGAYRYRAENLGGERITDLEAVTHVLRGWRSTSGTNLHPAPWLPQTPHSHRSQPAIPRGSATAGVSSKTCSAECMS